MPAEHPVMMNLGSGTPLAIRHTLAASQTFVKGNFVTLNAAEDVIEATAADQTPLYGMATENAADVIEAGFVVVNPFTASSFLRITGDNDPTADDVNQSYGWIEDGDGVYTVDGTDTTNTFFYVVDVDTINNVYFVTVPNAADRAFGG